MRLELIYRPSMDSPPARSTAVTAAAVVAILAGLFLLLCFSVALLALLLVRLPNTAPELPPSVRTLAMGAQGFLICLSLFGIATGIGLIYLRNWARISVLIWGGFSVFFGLIGIPIAFFTQFPPNPRSPALPEESMQVVRWFLLGIYGIPLLIGIWWLSSSTARVQRHSLRGRESLPIKGRGNLHVLFPSPCSPGFTSPRS